MSDTIYTCPMHPDVQAREPGRCPKCGMKLEPKAAMRSHRTRTALAKIAAWTLLATACGGSQPPTESPEATPDANEMAPAESPPADAPDAGADTHTMPDGTTMPGAEHGEGTGEHQH